MARLRNIARHGMVAHFHNVLRAVITTNPVFFIGFPFIPCIIYRLSTLYCQSTLYLPCIANIALYALYCQMLPYMPCKPCIGFSGLMYPAMAFNGLAPFIRVGDIHKGGISEEICLGFKLRVLDS